VPHRGIRAKAKPTEREANIMLQSELRTLPGSRTRQDANPSEKRAWRDKVAFGWNVPLQATGENEMAQRGLVKLLVVVSLAASGVSQTPTATVPGAPAASLYLTPYGPPITLEAAKKVALAAQAEAMRNHWLMTVAVVDPAGNLVYYERTDNSQVASSKVAIEKARAAAIYKRPTKAFQDAIAKGGVNLRVLALDGAVAVEGGVPLISEGRIIGAIGVSGDLSENDAQCASVAAQELK
jgi:glc operon protein GlcG